MPDATCRSCHAPIRWTRTAATGRLMPIDHDPVPGGNIRLDHTHTPTPIAHYIEPTDTPAYVSHFATCPNATHHRNR